MTTIVRIPADVDRSDRIIGPFTIRHVAVLASTALGLYTVWIATKTVIAPVIFVAAVTPIAIGTTIAVLTRRDGLSADLLLVAAIRHRLRPRHLVSSRGSGAGRRQAPRWITDRATRSRPRPPAPAALTAQAVRLPESVSASASGGVGVIDLGTDGLAVIAVAGTLNLSLRTPTEQDSLVGQLAGWLHTLRQPVQILVRSARLDLTEHITGLHTAAGQMSPELAAAALDHADHLTDLVAAEQPTHRQALLIWREPAEGLSATRARPRLPGRGRARRAVSAAARRGAESRLLRRMNEAADVLGPLGVSVTGLDDAQALAVLTSCTNPEGLVSAAADIAAPSAIITTDPDSAVPDPFTGKTGFAPESLTISTRHLEIGSDWAQTLAVTGYPREVTAGWLAPLLSHPGRVEVAIHIDPVDPVTAATRLRRQQARLESSRMGDLGRGRVSDPQIDVAVEDAADLSARVARAEARLFRVAVYLSVHADSETELADEVAAVRALAASLLVDTCTLSYRAAQAWATTLPLGLDLIRVQRTFDTTALAAAFPFDSPQLPAPDPAQAARPHGVLYGRDAASGLLFVDRFAPEAHNHNLVILGRSGAGKSYLVKTEILRSLYRGIEQIVIDPEDEYRRLADTVGGTHIRLGAPGVRLNPFDLEIHTRPDGRRSAPPDGLTRRKLFLHTLIQVLLGDQTAAQRTALDTALADTYTAAGITDDPATWTRPAPTLSGLRAQLDRLGSPTATELAAGLHPYVGEGAYAGVLDGPTTTDPEGGLIVFSLRDLPEELKTIGTLLVLDLTWRRVSHPGLRRPRMITVDEAWLLLSQPAGARFLFRAAKSFRKHWAGLTVATQDCADVCSTELGKAIVSNAATQILLRQAPQAIDEVATAFHLSDGEQQFLLSAARGSGLLTAGGDRAVFGSLASFTENAIITTDPSELAASADEPGIDIDIDPSSTLPALTAQGDPATAPSHRGKDDIDADEKEEVVLDNRAA
ncbi:PrgI family protein [Nocardia fluminea]|uniref:Type IV secretory pathway VirB4 component n=1 Tax=Nocardia fluminea TaxID=134984 RepID=A0A2N3VFW1_9NOCA|nr:PrgI family protein [Nocardia fluminea]PKV80510.1 type IV secretory pathway VirB4 component [Nocardia fluminea]